MTRKICLALLCAALLLGAASCAPPTPRPPLDQGMHYYGAGDCDKAIEAFTQAINQEAGDIARAYEYRGACYLIQSAWQAAADDYTKLIEDFERQNAALYAGRGYAYLEMGEHARARADLKRALEKEPDHLDARFNLGRAYQDGGMFSFAIEEYTRALALDPDHFYAYLNRGIAHCALEDWQPAIDDLSKAAELDPENPLPYGWLGEAHYHLEHYAEALKEFETLVEISGKEVDRFIIDRIQEIKGRLEDTD